MTLNEVLKVIPKYRHHEIGYWDNRNVFNTIWCNSTDLNNSMFQKLLNKYGDCEVIVITATPKQYVDLQITITRPL